MNKMLTVKRNTGWIQPGFPLVKKGEGIPFNFQKGNADGHGNCLAKSHMEQRLQ